MPSINDLLESYLKRKGENTIGGTILPEGNKLYDLGSAAKKFRKIYVDEFVGTTVISTHNHQADPAGGILDHGLALTGLGDDDHSQYLNAARHTADPHTMTLDGVDVSALATSVSTHAGLTTTAHGLGASAFHADAFFDAAGVGNTEATDHVSAERITGAQNRDFPAQDDYVKRDLLVARNIDAEGNLVAGAVAGTNEHALTGGLTVTETDATRAAGSFNQAGAAAILEAKDSGTVTWYAADGGGQVSVPQAGGHPATEGMMGVDNANTGFVRRKQYLNGMWRNLGSEDSCQNRDFLVTWA
jgi:hypothetical protein